MTSRDLARGVAGAAALIAVLTLLARLAGFGRTLVFTNTVGAGSTGDVYLAANQVPNIVFEVVAGGALAALVVPMLAGGIAVGDREQVRRTASALLGWTLLVLTPLAILIAVLAEPIAGLLLGGGTDEEVALAARFLLVFAPQVVLYGIGIVLTGVLQAHRRFAGPAIAPLLSSVVVAALRDTIIAFAPGLLGYGLVALLTRALYARGLWKAPTVCVVGGWLLAVVADIALSAALPPEDRGLALGAGHTIGVTVAGLGLLVVLVRVAGPSAFAGLPRVGGAALLGAALGGAAGLWVSRALGADPVPDGGMLAAVGAGVLAGGTVLVVAAAVMMGTARGAVTAAYRALRAPTRQEVHGD
jgi:putative peptidoglycan lipid II flippase